MLAAIWMIAAGFMALYAKIRAKYKKNKAPVAPQQEIKPIENILHHITHMTTLALDDRRQRNYEESKVEITLEDISNFKRKRKTFAYHL